MRTVSMRTDVSLSLNRSDFLLLGALGVVATAILASSRWEISATQPEPGTSHVPIEVDLKSVAVLPFVNMSGDQQNEYFSDGLTETLMHMLARLSDLKVASLNRSIAVHGVMRGPKLNIVLVVMSAFGRS